MAALTFVLSCTYVKSFGLEEKNQSVVTTGEAAWLWQGWSVTTGEAAWLWQGWSVVVMPAVACWLALMLRQGECP